MCVSPVCVCACASRIIAALFSLLSVLVFTRRSYLMRPHRRSKPRSAPGRSLFSPPEGQIAVLRDSDEAGEREFVKRTTIKCADMAGTSPVLSHHSGKRVLVCQLMILTDKVSSVYEPLRLLSSTSWSLTVELLLTVVAEAACPPSPSDWVSTNILK